MRTISLHSTTRRTRISRDVFLSTRVGRISVFLLAALCWSGVVHASGFGNKHVVIFGIDGCRPDALLAANAPNLKSLATNGTVAWDSFAGGYPGTQTQQPTTHGAGWGSVLTGVWTNKNRIAADTLAGYDAANYPHFFRRLKEANASAYLSSIVEWSPLDTSLVAPVAAYTSFRQTGSFGVTTDLVAKATAHLAGANPDVLFLQFSEVEQAGQASGYGVLSNAYMLAITRVDAGIGSVLNAVRARPNYATEDWLYIAVSDHGGSNFTHGGQSPAERNVFVIVSGNLVPKQTISSGPGLTCVAPTVLGFLGVPVAPAWNWESSAFGLSPNSIASNLVAYLNFDGSLNAQAGTTINATVLDWQAPYTITGRFTNGLIGQAASFANNASIGQASDWVASLGNLEWIYSNSFSYSLWMRMPANVDAGILGNKDWNSGANVGWVATTANWKILNYCATNGVRRDISIPSSIANSNWHLVTATFNRTVNQVVVFYDGQPAGTNDISPSGSASLNAGFATLIGASGPGTWAGTSDVDELAMWTRVLTPTEVADLYAKGISGRAVPVNYSTPPIITAQPASLTTVAEGFDTTLRISATNSGLSYQWRLNGTNLSGAIGPLLMITRASTNQAGAYSVVITNAGGAVTSNPALLAVTPRPAGLILTNGLLAHLTFDGDYLDRSGHGFHGQPIRATSFVPGPIGGCAFQFNTPQNGSNISYVTLGTNIVKQIASNDFTVSFWINCSNYLRDPAWVGNKNWNLGASPGFVIAAQPGRTLTLNMAGTGGRVDGYSSAVVGDGSWHHLAITCSRASNAVIYVDGWPNATNSVAGIAGSFDAGLPLNLGQDGTGSYTYFNSVGLTNAAMDDFALWSRALTPTEVLFTFMEGRDFNRSFEAVIPAPAATVGAPRLLANGHFQASFTGTPYQLYRVDTAPAATGTWTFVTNIHAAGDGSFTWELPALPAEPARFYRTMAP